MTVRFWHPDKAQNETNTSAYRTRWRNSSKPKKAVSGQCALGRHRSDCRNLECTCECHAREPRAPDPVRAHLKKLRRLAALKRKKARTT